MNTPQSPSSSKSQAASRPLARNPDELNEDCVRQLVDAGVERGHYIAVVGAGPSNPVIPSDELRREMATACGLDQNDSRPFWDFFEDAREKDRDAFCRIIKKRFEDTPHLRLESYRQIVSIPFKSFITLNYDIHLPAAFGDKFGENWQQRFSIYPMREGPNGKSVGVASAVDLGGHKPRLVAVHGYRDQQDSNWPATKIVLTRSDYNKHYFSFETGTYLVNWWKEVLTIHDCLFIGTSLQEPGLRLVIDYLVSDENPEFRKRKHLHLKGVPFERTKRSEAEYSDGYPPPERVYGCISQVLFDPKDQFSGLVEVLSRISRLRSLTSFDPQMPGLGPIQPTPSPFAQ